ncbi:MAG TPA: hypothetical protein VN457_03735, partial [Chlamydiales bacterium]|nr:hypothetical protein [Chlamydiales bacterium]
MSQPSFDFTQHDYQFTEHDKELAIVAKPKDKAKKEDEKATQLHTFIVSHPPATTLQAEKLLTFASAYKKHLQKTTQQSAVDVVQKIEQQVTQHLLMKASYDSCKQLMGQVKTREINPLLQKALAYVLSHDESLSYLSELMAVPMTKFQALALIAAIKEITKTEPLAPHLKILKAIATRAEALKALPEAKERSIQTLLRTMFFKEVTLKKCADIAKQTFSAEETRGLAIERHGTLVTASLDTQAFWKNKQVVRLVNLDKPTEIFGRVITLKQQVHKKPLQVADKHKPFIEQAKAAFEKVKKPLDATALATVKALFAESIKQEISPASLYSVWESSFSGKTSLQDHQKEFFAIFLQALQGSDGATITKYFDELQSLGASLFSDPDLNQLMQQMKATMQEVPLDKAIQKFCLESLSRVCASSFTTDVTSILHAQCTMARIGFLKDRNLLTAMPWADWEKTSNMLEAETKKVLKAVFAKSHPEKTTLPSAYLHETAIVNAQNNYCLQLANILIRQKGGLNQFLIPDAEQYLIQPPQQSPFDRTIAHVLHELKANPRLKQTIDEAGTSPVHATGKSIIQLYSGLPVSAIPSAADIQRTILGAALTTWRQRSLDSCHTTATVLSTKDT